MTQGLPRRSQHRLGITTSHDADHEKRPHSAVRYMRGDEGSASTPSQTRAHCTELHVSMMELSGRFRRRGIALYLLRGKAQGLPLPVEQTNPIEYVETSRKKKSCRLRRPSSNKGSVLRPRIGKAPSLTLPPCPKRRGESASKCQPLSNSCPWPATARASLGPVAPKSPLTGRTPLPSRAHLA